MHEFVLNKENPDHLLFYIDGEWVADVEYDDVRESGLQFAEWLFCRTAGIIGADLVIRK